MSFRPGQGRPERVLRIVELVGLIIAGVAMVVVGLRAALRLEMRWDTFWYHIPFAARRAGMGIPYTFPPDIQGYSEGFPPLADFLQGLLWRASGSINGTGVLNYLGLLLFFFFCTRYLTGRFWVAVTLALMAPLVLIHAASSYIDLFSNAMLAIGVTAFLGMLLRQSWDDKRLLAWGLSGVVAAAWSKYQTVPMVAVTLIAFFIVYCRRSRRMALWIALATVVAAAPYVKNIIVYHNPFWPFSLPVLRDQIPFTIDSEKVVAGSQSKGLVDKGQTERFVRSVLEVDHPTSYPHRERWIIDQGNTSVAFRAGGFWNVGVITRSLAACLLAFLASRRRGWIVLASLGFIWIFVSQLPGSSELRYYMFIPLTIAALAAMSVPEARAKHPRLTLAILVIVLGEFIYVSSVNRSYYRIERAGFPQAVKMARAENAWSRMEEGKTYCMVGFEPVAILYTGPTLHEFKIVDVPEVSLCPIERDGVFVRRDSK